MPAQPRRARAGGPHAVKEGPFREVPLTAMGGGLREQERLGMLTLDEVLYETRRNSSG